MFRSTWIVSSLEGIRARGHFERYQSFLDRHRKEILSCIAGTWLPISVAREHYQACDRLDVSDDEYICMALDGSQVRRVWNARMIAESRAPDATPWTAFSLVHRGWGRTCQGGAMGVFRLAENRARLEYVNCELFDIPYFCRAVRYMIYLLAGRTAENLKVRELAEPEAGSCIYLADWQ